MNFKASISRWLRLFLAWFPTALPQGRTEFEDWANSILDLYNLPNNPSFHFALGGEILHTASGRAYAPKRKFGLAMRKFVANQVASQVMHELKMAQEALIKKEQQEAAAAAEKAKQEQQQQQQQTAQSNSNVVPISASTVAPTQSAEASATTAEASGGPQQS